MITPADAPDRMPPEAGAPPRAAEPVPPAAEPATTEPGQTEGTGRTAEERLLESIVRDPRREAGPDATSVDDTFPPDAFEPSDEEPDELPAADEPVRADDPVPSVPVWDQPGSDAVGELAGEGAAAVSDESDRVICGLEARLQEALAELQTVRDEGRQVTADRDDLVQRLELAAGEFDRLHQELDEARQRAGEAQAALKTARDAMQAENQAALQAAQEQADAVRRERDAAVAQAARPEAEERRLRVELKDREGTIRQLQAAHMAETQRMRVRVGAGAAALALVAVALGYGFGRAGRPARPASHSDLLVAPSNAVSAGALAPTLPRTSAVARVVQPAGPVWPAIRDPGLTVREEPGALVIVFNEPLFARGSELALDARRDLRRLAALLKPYAAAYRIEVEGHTDAARAASGQSRAGNRELGLLRARAAQDVLVKEGGLPAATVSISSAGDANPLVPGDTPDERRRNRTVVIKLHAARGQ